MPQSNSAETIRPHYKKGDVWMVTSDPEKPAVGSEIWSDRPAIIVSANLINNHAGIIQIVYLSTALKKRTGPCRIQVPSPDPKTKRMIQATALCDQVHTVDVSRMKHRMGYIPGPRIREIDEAIALSLSLGRNPDHYAVFAKWENHIKTQNIDYRAEVQALAGQTTDQRVEALTRALEIVTSERDSWRTLYESGRSRPAAMRRAAQNPDTKDTDP